MLIDSILTASTAHITETDNKLLEKEKDFTVAKFEEGYFLFTTIDSEIPIGYSKAFHNLIAYAVQMNCQYICLDCDTRTIDGLPIFKW